MQEDTNVLPELLRRLRGIGTAMNNQGTFRMRVLLGMLLHEMADEIARTEKRARDAAKPPLQ